MKKIFSLGLLLAGLFGRARPENLPLRPVAEDGAKEFNVRDFGATGKGRALDTEAIQKAVDACALAGGGRVRLPAGTYLSGTVFLKSRVTLELDKGATLLGSAAAGDYPLSKVRWEGEMRDGHCSLIHAANAEHIAVTGQGTVSGADPCMSRAPRGPMLVEFLRCRDVRVEGVTLKNSGIWTLHPTFCEDVVVQGVSFETQGHNSDGLNPDSCRRVLVENCVFSDEDDCIALKSGKGQEGRRLASPCEDVVIRGCVFMAGHSLALGSECSGGIRRVSIENCRFEEGMKGGVRLKTNPGRGGFIEDVTIRGIDYKGAAGSRFLEALMKVPYNPDPQPLAGPEGVTRVGNIHVENVRMSGGSVGSVQGDAGKPIQGLVFKNITGLARQGLDLSNAVGVDLEGLAYDVEEGPKVGAENVSGKGLE